MGQQLTEIAQTLRDAKKKVQLIYGFNGTGKTRLSREFKRLIVPKDVEDEEEKKIKVLYYNAFTEDLFYWDNDLDTGVNRKLLIRPNQFTKWVLQEQGKEKNIKAHFQRYTNDKLTPHFNEKYDEVIFSIAGGNDENIENIKISKGEESNFIWCVFYSLLEHIVEVLNVTEKNERETNQFDDLQYIFIDDPVSSLDDTHLIELAVDIAELIKSSQYEKLKFIITTHNPLFYNVLFNELNKFCCYILDKNEDGTFSLGEHSHDSPFSYHLYLFLELEKAIQSDDIKKYHFNFLRNILEKTSTFLGYDNWKDLLPDEAEGSSKGYYIRIINLSSHSKSSDKEISVVGDNEKRVLKHLVHEVKRMYGFKSRVNHSINEGNDTV
ncbi:MAG: anticodon nuclease [Bergeyella sp.]|nr:anticodon nuclease [Bergeyella sp.]